MEKDGIKCTKICEWITYVYSRSCLCISSTINKLSVNAKTWIYRTEFGFRIIIHFLITTTTPMGCLANKFHLSKEKWQPCFVAVCIETWRLFWLLSILIVKQQTIQNTQETTVYSLTTCSSVHHYCTSKHHSYFFRKI